VAKPGRDRKGAAPLFDPESDVELLDRRFDVCGHAVAVVRFEFLAGVIKMAKSPVLCAIGLSARTGRPRCHPAPKITVAAIVDRDARKNSDCARKHSDLMTVPSIPPNPSRRAFALIAQVSALLIAIFCALVSVWFLYDAACLAHSPNDWGDPAKIDVLFIWVVNILGWLVSLPLAIFIRPVRPGLLMPTLVFALSGVLLLCLAPAAMRVNKARHQKEFEELVRKMEPRMDTNGR
jgi:hypothetical protein